MKVTGPGGPMMPAASRPARATGGFSVPSGSTSATGPAAAAGAAGGVAGLSGLMALQGVDDPLERRRRNIRRGSGLLDRLDELKLALLSGADGQTALQGLSRAAAEARAEDDTPGLTAILDQIDLRAAVELAKAQRQAA